MKRNQQVYTAFELLAVIYGLICIGLFGTVIYVVAHFIVKYW